VDNLNKLIAGTDLAEKSLEEIIKITAKDSAKAGIFNNAAQIWNHSFYWQCLKKSGGGSPTGAIAAKINAAWGSYDKFAEELKNAGVTQFGSGWAWLVLENGQFKITKQLMPIHLCPWSKAAFNYRCLGTCLLPGLSKQKAGLSHRCHSKSN